MEIFKYAVLTGAGSFIGGSLRYLVSTLMQSVFKTGYPVGTFLVNVTGSFIIGMVLALWEDNYLSDTGRIFFATGILGGYTTFSSFSQEFLLMIREGQTLAALVYIFLSVIIGGVGCAAGYILTK